MNVFKNIEEVKFDKNTILTVGSFDGIHKGHRLILDHLIETSKKENLRNLLVTFEPHPQVVLQNKVKGKIKIITTLEEKLHILEKIGVENVWVIEFNEKFSQTSAEDFLIDYLIKTAGMKKFLIGYDHMFGKNREGDKDLLERLSPNYNYEIERLSSIQLDNTIISSTEIRKAIIASEIDLANKMLGRNFNVMGEVIHGKKRGNTIGFPTANIIPNNDNKLIPSNGVYVVRAEIKGNEFFGMCNIGVRPTFGDLEKEQLEIHFFDLEMDLYGKVLNIEFLKFVREEKKFNVLDELVKQLKNDKGFSLGFLKENEY